LRIKLKRKDSKIKDLLKVAKNTKMLSNTSYNILNNDFGESFSLFENEIKNLNKSPHGRRYSEEVKKFAVTLHHIIFREGPVSARCDSPLPLTATRA